MFDQLWYTMSNKIVPLHPSNSTKPRSEPTRYTSSQAPRAAMQTAFDRKELSIILSVYGQMVSQGDWKDYALDFLKDKAVFSIFRRASEQPLYKIEKIPALKAKQGQFCVIAPGGLILKRGHDLRTVLKVFDKQRFRVTK